MIALTYIYGIGPKHSSTILAAANIEPTTRVKDLTEAEEQRLREVIDRDYTTEGDLQRLVTNNIKRLRISMHTVVFATKLACQYTANELVRMHELVRVKQSQLVAHNLKQQVRRRKGNRLWQKRKLSTASKKQRRSVPAGQLHIQATFNNTIVTLCRQKRQRTCSFSAGACGFRGSKKGTAYAAQVAAEKAAKQSKSRLRPWQPLMYLLKVLAWGVTPQSVHSATLTSLLTASTM